MRLDLSDLRLFLHVVDAGSIGQGASRAHLALASASERLRRIEADAGVALLERHPRGVRATEAGEALAHHARRLLRGHGVLRDELQAFATGARGTLRLYANTAATTGFLPRALAPWLAARPGLRIDLKERTSAEIVRAVAAGRIQAGVVADSVDPGGLHLHPVADDRLVLVVPPGHPLAAAREAAFADVLASPFVGLAPGSALQDHPDAHAAAAGRSLAFRIRVRTFEDLCLLVSQGVGVGIVPASAARRHRRRHPHRALALREPWAQRRLCVCVRDWRTLSPPMRELLVHLGASPSLGAGG
ncbi:LysR family transcriptional regulator [Luteimonas sp. FCS-9]|uniref:LysR family transcriptional regulator n=1 Tax=Luteimonas sp. FCS-9 TaxID=1547516 RepID=UPI00063E9A25|nr:LysR family transcriptional regulator [Luteimonas sp. FCS-9]KLI97783.1 LysR family transcriptional regulator [Luteimonas sp. FCS-9]